jgi:hypothetical protein
MPSLKAVTGQDLIGKCGRVAAVLFLAGVDWYGHRKELLAVAETLRPGSPGHLAELVQLTGFDLSRFSQSLRRQLSHARAAS